MAMANGRVRGVVAGAGLAALLGSAGLWRATELRRAPSVTVEGRVLDPGVDIDAWVSARGRAAEGEPVRVWVEGDPEDVRREELGLGVDVGRTAAAVRARGERPFFERLGSLFGARAHRTGDVKMVWRLDRARAAERLAAFAPRVRRDPTDARLDLMRHENIDDVPGAELDEAATLDALAAFDAESEGVFELVTKPVPAAVTRESLAAVDVSKVLASLETNFSLAGTGAGRALNIANAASHLDGYVLGPGQTMSFNQVVGPRTEAAGFTHAPEIFDDELQDGIGGGTCQLASTLHGAAVFGALDVVQRRSHGRPSSYTRLGLDATVVYPEVDLRLRNPYPFPVLIHAFLPKKTSVRVEILGADPVVKVDYRYAVTKSEDFYRRITLKRELGPGAVVHRQKGRRGQDVVSVVTMTWPDGHALERSYRSDYHPVPEVLWVGPGVDESNLPDLPEGATRVERRGVPDPPSNSAPSG